jgi:hypothetical protein
MSVGRHGAVLALIRLKWLTPKTWIKPLEFPFFLSRSVSYNYVGFDGRQLVSSVPTDIATAIFVIADFCCV